MKVLLSIKPQYASLIFTGEKRVEYRRTVFAREDIEHAYVYASLPVGGVVGEFRIAGIIKGSPDCVWRKTRTQGGISRSAFREYFSGAAQAYAIEIGEFELYESPLELMAAFDVRPPQSFAYVGAHCEGKNQTAARLAWRRTQRKHLLHEGQADKRQPLESHSCR